MTLQSNASAVLAATRLALGLCTGLLGLGGCDEDPMMATDGSSSTTGATGTGTGASASGSTATDTGATAGTGGGGIYATTIQPIWDRSCTDAACHATLFVPILSGDSYANIVNVPSTQVASLSLIAPGSLETSYLWIKLENLPGIVGAQMPNEGTLDPVDRTTIQNWILGGAVQ